MSDDPLNATIIERRDLSDELAIVRVSPDGGVVPEFEPGQFINLALPPDSSQQVVRPANAPPRKGPRLVRRSYSIASANTVRDHVELYLVLVPTGKLTPRLWTIPQGGRVWMDDKAGGTFTLDGIPRDKDLVMIATGTGIAPYVSMLRTYRESDPAHWRKLVIVHGVRYERDLGYHTELTQAAAEDERVIYIPMVTREPATSAWQGMRGRVQTLLEEKRGQTPFQEIVGSPLNPTNSEVFLCGNPAMIDTMQAQLEAMGFTADTMKTRGDLHFERYW